MQAVLVVEDDLDTRDLYLECLEAEGFTAIGAENGQIGVNKARQMLPDVVVCDIMMPDLDGYGVLADLHRDPTTAGIPVIFLSAKFSKADLRQGMELGVDDYLTKPCTAEELLGAIASCLKKRAMLERYYTDRLKPAQLPSRQPEQPAGIAASEPFFPHLCPRLTKVFEFLEVNYHQPISLEIIAQAVGYSPAYLTNLVRKKTGRSVYSWVIERRMMAARTLLSETDQSIEMIARAVGYLNLCNFFRQFRQHAGMTPKAWRASHKV